jgi:hypothetical protein
VILSAVAILHILVLGSSFTLLNILTSPKLTLTSAGTGFWTYVEWDFFAHLNEYYTPLKPITIFNTLYMKCLISLLNRTKHVLKKVKFSLYRPWRPLGLREVEAPTFSRQSAHRWR